LNRFCFIKLNDDWFDNRPTIEEVESWADSFEKLMQHPAGRFFFREFLRSEYSEENMLFWQACEELKAELTPEEIEEKARLVYEDFISILSPREVHYCFLTTVALKYIELTQLMNKNH
jgi:regulator of G-protein signaling